MRKILIQKIISIVVESLVGIIVIVFTSSEIFSIIIGLVAILAQIEFLKMYNVDKNIKIYYPSLTIFVILNLLFILRFLSSLISFILILLLAVFALALITQKVGEKNFKQVTIIISGIVYIIPFSYYLLLMRFFLHGREVIIVLCVGTATRDIVAFIYGLLMPSGHTILQEINERKTYEGTFAGLVFTMIAVVFTGEWLIRTWPLGDLVVIGFLIGTLGQIGDLVESWFKRNANLIDSSQLFYKQGGLLDQLDSLIFTAPAVYLYILVRMLAT